MSRPEYQLPAHVFYGAEEAKRYGRSSRMQAIQSKLAERALELLLLPSVKEGTSSSFSSSTCSASSVATECSMASSEEEQQEAEEKDEEDEEQQQRGPKQQPALLLDLGVGSGISASCLVEKGHFVVGVDVSRFMLEEAIDLGNTEERTDVVLADLGQRLNFRPAVFDGAISISAIQWLCSGVQSSPLQSPALFAGAVARSRTAATPTAEGAHTAAKIAAGAAGIRAHAAAKVATAESEITAELRCGEADRNWLADEMMERDQDEEGNAERNTQVVMLAARTSADKNKSAGTHTSGGGAKFSTPYARLRRFFMWLYACLRPGARAALQFYPDSTQQVETITAAALRAGFNGGLVVDYPNSTKAKKHFLVLWVGGGRMSSAEQQLQLQTAAVDSQTQPHVQAARRERHKRMKKRGGKAGAVSRRQWIIKKKEKQRLQGKDVRHDSKYVGRKRKDKF